MRAAFVLTSVVVGLALGVVAAGWESRVLVAVLITGLMAAIWALLNTLERVRGRDMWDFTAPYPYRWMRERGEDALPPPNVVGKPVEDTRRTEVPSKLPRAA
jgi:hypothetical protein